MKKVFLIISILLFLTNCSFAQLKLLKKKSPCDCLPAYLVDENNNYLPVEKYLYIPLEFPSFGYPNAYPFQSRPQLLGSFEAYLKRINDEKTKLSTFNYLRYLTDDQLGRGGILNRNASRIDSSILLGTYQNKVGTNKFEKRTIVASIAIKKLSNSVHIVVGDIYIHYNLIDYKLPWLELLSKVESAYGESESRTFLCGEINLVHKNLMDLLAFLEKQANSFN